jgi:HD-like signal output (HDOD) protein
MPTPKNRPPGYGQGVHRVEGEWLECELDTYDLKARLLELFRSPAYRPPLLPAVALEVLALTREPDVRISKIVTLLGHDPMLAGQLINVARSAAYSRGEPIHSLEQAVTRLGLSRVADLFLRVSLEAKVFRAPGYAEPMAELRRHSAFVAEAARLVSQATCGLDDYAFLCGLLHDVGIAACILAFGGPLQGLVPGDFSLAWQCVQPIHESCSELLAGIWGLPADVGLVLRLHHQPALDGRVHPLAAAIRLADASSALVGRGFMSEVTPQDLEQALGQLKLSGAAAQRLKAQLEALAQQLSD